MKLGRIGVKSMVFHYARASIPNLCSRILTRQVAECRLLAIYILHSLDVLNRVTLDDCVSGSCTRARLHICTIHIVTMKKEERSSIVNVRACFIFDEKICNVYHR